MIPVFMVALACVGVALNILSDNPPLLRHPTVRKLVSDSSRWTQTNARRLLDQQQRAIAATKRVYRDLSDDNWTEARLRVRQATGRLSTLPSRTRLRASVPPPRRDVVVYKPFEVELYQQPESGTCPVPETCPAGPWWPFPATVCDIASSSLELASVPPTCPLTESPSDTLPPPLPVHEASRSLRRPVSPSSLFSSPGLSAGNTMPSVSVQLFGPLPVQESSVLAAVDNTLGGAAGLHWLPAILSGCFVLLAMVLMFPSKRGARLGKRGVRRRTPKNVKTSAAQSTPQAESVIATPAALCSVVTGNSGDFTPLVNLGDSSISCELPLFDDDSHELMVTVNSDSELYDTRELSSDTLAIPPPSPSPSSTSSVPFFVSVSSIDPISVSPSATGDTAPSSPVATNSPSVVDDEVPQKKKRTRRGDHKRRDEKRALKEAKHQARLLSGTVPSSTPSSASVPGSATTATSNTSMAPPARASTSTSSSASPPSTTTPVSLPDATSPAQKPKKRTRRGKRKQQVKIETKVEHVAPVCDIVADDVAPAVSPRSSSSVTTSCSNATHAITPAMPNALPSATTMTTTTAHMAPAHSGVHPLGLRRAANDAVAGSARSSASVPGSSTTTTTASAGSSRAQTPPPAPPVHIHDDSPST